MGPSNQTQREDLEIRFWEESESERPGARSLDAFTNKMSEARIVLEKFDAFRSDFEAATSILELGGGQGWVSCMVSREFPGKEITASDISPAAVESLVEWERIFETKVTSSFACRSYDIPAADDTFDLVFAFASAHHFGAHRRTFREIHRVLRPGGRVLYLHEPACRNFFYKPAVRRVNRKRPVVQEDVLRLERIRQLASEAAFEIDIRPSPTTTYRGAIETVYYLALQRVPPLQRVLPCTVDIALTKPAA